MDYPLIVGNWKMNLSLSEALVLSGQIARYVESIKHINVVICPPAVYIYPIYDAMKARPNNLYLGIQNAMWESEGQYTGEISLDMVRNVCKYAIIGHSERRQVFNETDEMIAKKVRFCLDSNITPIICIGEKEKFNLEEEIDYELKRMGSDGGILTQLDKALSDVDNNEISKVYFAYEPIWAIGTGNAATGIYASAISYIIRGHIKKKIKIKDDEINILYGGSVDEKNAKEYLMQPNLNGLLVGGSSLKSKSFSNICSIASEAKSGK